MNFLVLVDRYSNWLSIYQGVGGHRNLIKTLRTHFSTFGFTKDMSTDGGPEFTCKETQSFLKDRGVKHCQSSAYFPHSNCWAELGVKSGKSLPRENTGPRGELNTDKLMRAILLYRNTPDQGTRLSPAQVIFGHKIRDFFPVLPGRYSPRPERSLTMEEREKALMKRQVRARERLTLHTKVLPKLQVGDHVLIQKVGQDWQDCGSQEL